MNRTTEITIALGALAAQMAFCQAPNANQWYGWTQCSVNVQGPIIDGNGTILGQYFHQETQTWQLTNAAPAGVVYPANWSVNGSGWETVEGRTWTVSSPLVSAPLQIITLASNQQILVNSGAHAQIRGPWATATHPTETETEFELSFPAINGAPGTSSITGSHSYTDTAGKYGVLQGGGPTAAISCRWNYAKGSYPPPPLHQVVTPPPPPPTKPANEPAGSVFVPITPCRAVDTRPTRLVVFGAQTGIYPSAPKTFQLAGTGSHCGIPAIGPTALSLNVTAVPLEPLTGLYIRPIGQAPAPAPLLSATDGNPTANAVILPFGSGEVEVSVTNHSHVVIDINGYFMPANTPGGSLFFPIQPCFALNTMNPSSTLAAATERDVDVHAACSHVPAGATAVVMDVTVTPVNNFLGFLTAWPTGKAQPITSNINAYDGQVKSNMVIAQLGTGGKVSFLASDATNVTAVVVGYFGGSAGTSGGLSYHPMPACTAVDTQAANGPDGGPELDAYSTRDFPIGQSSACGVPGWSRMYAMNLIATPPAVLTGLDVQPMGMGNSTAWSLYARDGQVTASAAVVAAGAGGLTVTPYSPTHLKIILNGYFD